MENAKNLFKNHFGYTPFHYTRSPAVLELIGGLAYLYEGLSLAIPIEKYVEIAASPRTDGKIEFIISSLNGVFSFPVSRPSRDSTSNPENYIKSLISNLQSHGVAPGGFNAAIFHNLATMDYLEITPILLIATALTIRKLYPFRLTETGTMIHPPKKDKYGVVEPPSKNEKFAIANLCFRSKKGFGEFDTSIIPELTSLFGKKHHAICIDSKHNSFEHIPMFGEIALIAFKIKKDKKLEILQLKNLYRLSESAKTSLLVKSLRSIDLSYLRFKQKNLNKEEYDFAYYALGENQRVIFSERALEDGDFEQFGQYMIFSHESARDFLRIVPDETEKLFQISIKQKGCMGARMIFSKFADATINLVEANHYEDFIRQTKIQFEQETGFDIEATICISADCAV